MKITLEFDDLEEAKIAIHSSDVFSKLWKIDQEMRSILKYDGHADKGREDISEMVRSMIHEDGLMDIYQ